MTPPTQSLLCPKCTSEMRSYERNGVTIDQCTSCKGVFLDRGELDRLIDAEGSFYDGPKSAPAAAPPAPAYRDDHRYRDDDRPRDYRSGGYDGKRRKSFLSELFD